LAVLTMLGPMSVDMYLPALPAMARSLATTDSALQLTITGFLLGFGVGPLVLGPLSDTVGRRPVLIGCVVVFVLMSLLCARATSVEELIGYRVIQALSGGSATTIARNVIHDQHHGDVAARQQSILMMVLSLALMAAPALGGQLLSFFGWRSLFITLAGLGLISLLSVVLFLPETLAVDRRRPFRLLTILGSYGQVFTSKPAMGFTMAGAFAGGAMFAYLTATPFVFIDHYGLDPTIYGALFAVNMVGAILINWINMRVVTRFGYRRMLAAGAILLLATSVLLFVITAIDVGGILGLMIAIFAIVGLAHIMGTNGLTGTLDLFREGSGAVSATFSASRFAAGILATLLVSALHDGTAWPLAVVILLCAVMAMLTTTIAIVASSKAT
jgi:MFS transporter, DHA1 family, multidrug resistance protein